MSGTRWPEVELDPVRRLRVMAAALGAAMYAEDHIDAPFAEVWSTVADLSNELPHLVPTVRRFKVLPSHLERTVGWAYGPLGHSARFDVLLQQGWCLMQSRYVVGGMAAVPEGGGTRFAVLGGLRQPAYAPVQVAVRALGRARGLRMIDRARRRTAARLGTGERPW